MALGHGRDLPVPEAREGKEEEMNILAMLQFAIVAGVILLVAAWGIYFWLKRTGRLSRVTRSGGYDGN